MSPVGMLKPPVSVYINACHLLSALLSLSQFGRGRLSLVAISFCALSLLFGPCRLSKFTLARPHTNVCKISRLWGAVSSLALNESLSNFVIFLIFGALFSGVNGFSRTCPCQKLEKKKKWKGLLSKIFPWPKGRYISNFREPKSNGWARGSSVFWYQEISIMVEIESQSCVNYTYNINAKCVMQTSENILHHRQCIEYK